MGSYCGIHFDDLSICDSKSIIPDDWAVLFQERDRREQSGRPPSDQEDEEQSRTVDYVATRDSIVSRLAILGATEEATRRAFQAWLFEERLTWKMYAEEWANDGHLGKHAILIAQELEDLDYDRWCNLASEVLQTRYDFTRLDARQADADPFKKQFYESDGSYLWFAGYGSHINLRALLDAAKDAKEVRLDISDLIDNEYVRGDEPISTRARDKAPYQIQTLAPTMVMAEGSTDLLALRLGLQYLYPDLFDYFSFFNHAELSVDGGAAYLVKFLKAIAAARSTSRILAIFDNDTTGLQAYYQAKALALPSNFVVARYPDSDIARAYPTVGPGGPLVMDVNGQAAGIELYLGRDALLYRNELRPVRWTGYNQSVGKYQGEVEGKGKVLETFQRNIAATENCEAARALFPELKKVWNRIFSLVEENRSADYLVSMGAPSDEGWTM